MHKTTSPKQLAANRRNALKSTGPRTLEGRAISRLNAVRHGILSKQVLVRGLVLQEDELELEALHVRFHDQLEPEGPMEEMLVDQIVTAHWRLRRALTAESGEIALSMDARQRGRSRGINPALRWMQWMAFGDPVHAMENSSIGNALLTGWLNDLRAAVETEGAVTEAAVQRLAARFGDKPNSLVLSLEDFRKAHSLVPAGEDSLLREQQKNAALAFVDRQLRSLQLVRNRLAEEDEFEEQARQAADALPSGAVLDKILRYETKLERQMYRAMAQLERVQRMRRGEDIPAPLAVEVSNRE